MHLSKGGLQRLFVVFELAAATIAKRPVVLLHAAGVVERQGRLLFLREEEKNGGIQSQIWSDELIASLWGIFELRRMLVLHVMDTRRDTVQTMPGRSEVRACQNGPAIRLWAILFDGLMDKHGVVDEAGKPFRSESISLSLGSILWITYELSLEIARLKLPRLITSMESHFLTGFISTELNVDSCTVCAQQLVAGLPQQKEPWIRKLLFPMQQPAQQSMASRLEGHISALHINSSIVVLCSRDCAWQAAILRHNLRKQRFNVLTCNLSEGMSILEQRSIQPQHAGIVLWFLSDGMLNDVDACDAAERAARLETVSHLCIHEPDDRKARFRFDWSVQLHRPTSISTSRPLGSLSEFVLSGRCC